MKGRGMTGKQSGTTECATRHVTSSWCLSIHYPPSTNPPLRIGEQLSETFPNIRLSLLCSFFRLSEAAVGRVEASG